MENTTALAIGNGLKTKKMPGHWVLARLGKRVLRPGGMELTRRMLDVLMKRYAERAGIPEDKRHFHVLKHSIATHLLDGGAELRFVQDWIGHASIGNTVKYAQLTSRRRDEEARKVFATPYVV